MNTKTDWKERIKKLPNWARDYIADLTHRALVAEAQIKTEHRPERDLPPPETLLNGELSKGWDFNAFLAETYPCRSVYKACSSCIHHGPGWDKTSSQQPRHLFSTELKAWQALRAEVSKRHAETLAKIDQRIAEATDEPAPK